MSVHRDTIRTLMEAKTAAISASPSGAQGEMTLVSSGKVKNFKAILTPAVSNAERLLVLPNALHVLGASMGHDVRYWQTKPRKSLGQETLVKAHI